MKVLPSLLCVTAAAALAAISSGIAAAPAPLQGDAASTGVFTGRDKFGETTGEAMYRNVCAACHMPNAKGAEGAGMYPSLAANPKLESSGYVLLVLMDGLNGMPPLGRMMTDQQAADVANYVRTHFGNRYKERATAEEAKAARGATASP